MYDFLKDKSEDFLAVVSMKVLKRPKDCLLNLWKELEGKMIKMENDQRLRKWQDDTLPNETYCLFYAAYKGVCVLDFSSTNPQGTPPSFPYPLLFYRIWPRRTQLTDGRVVGVQIDVRETSLLLNREFDLIVGLLDGDVATPQWQWC
jgi:hypothetical protein